VDNNYLNLGMNKSGFVHTLPSGRLMRVCACTGAGARRQWQSGARWLGHDRRHGRTHHSDTNREKDQTASEGSRVR
jgi:hypothetical protein